MRPMLFAVALLAPLAAFAADPLPSWHDGEAKTAILDFVAGAADPASVGYIPAPERVAVFDNDGTLWSEQPFYFQFLFAMDQAAALAAADPGWAATPALKAAAAGDAAGVLAGGEAAVSEVVFATHAGGSVPLSMSPSAAIAAVTIADSKATTTTIRIRGNMLMGTLALAAPDLAGPSTCQESRARSM